MIANVKKFALLGVGGIIGVFVANKIKSILGA